MATQLYRTLALAAALVGLLALASPAQAQDAGATLDDMSLEDLLNVQVVTASKSAESLSDASGIVSTISAREIEQFGATSLLEVLERVPGVYAIGTSGFPQGMISIRGDAATTINNHVLVLLDGRPMRESLHGGLNTPLYTAFPLESIDQIEIIRGPGSVLYGSNAYAGVINIITKKAKDGASFSSSVGYGSFDTRSFAAQGSYKKDELSVSAGLRLFKDAAQGESIMWAPTEDPMVWTPVVQNAGQAFNLGEDAVGATLSARYKGLSFRSFAGFNDQSYYPGGFGAVDPADFRHVTTDLGYEHALAPWWDASANVTFTYDRQLHNGADEMNRDVIVEATNYLRPFEKANLVVGGLVYALHGSSEMEMADFMNPTAPPTHVVSVAPYDAMWWSAYTQLDFRPVDKLKLIAGGQVNKVEGLGLDFVPRLGAVFNATDKVGAKLLFGQAFRSPYAVERSINIPGMLEGNSDLRPEKVTSLDAQVYYNTGHVQLAATYFNARQRDLIVKTSFLAPGAMWPTSSYNNKGELTIQGIELESKVAPNERLFFTGSFVYQKSEDDQGATGTTLVPEVIGKAGVSYAHPAGVTLGVFESFFSAPTSLYDLDPASWAQYVNPATGAFDPEAMGAHPEPKAFSYLTAKLTLDVTKLMNLHRFPTMQLDFYGTNLLGQDIYVSDIDLTNLSVPRQHGRSFYGAFRVKL